MAAIGLVLEIDSGLAFRTRAQPALTQSSVPLPSPPVITQQPRDQTVVVGASVTFSITATGQALRFQWRRNAQDVPGATNATLSLANVQAVHVGNYTVRVSNAAGAVISSAARLSLSVQVVPPAIASQPQSVTVTVGGRATFLVQATGAAPLQFQWGFNGRDLAGATNALLVLTNAQLANAGAYSVRVSNAAAAVTSADATPTVNPASIRPTITAQPQSRTVNAGATVVFTVVAAGTPPLQYQWRVANKNLFGATNATLTLTKVQSANAAVYSVQVSNAAGVAFSANADRQRRRAAGLSMAVEWT
jgi:hypothetical protein